MKCIEVRENLDALLDGEVIFSERDVIKSHLENCVSCQAEFENLQTISKSLKQTLPIAAPAFLDEKVLKAFDSFHKQKQPIKKEKVGWFGIPRFAFATAFILLALVSGLAFQLGRMSVGNVDLSSSVNSEKGQKFSSKQSDENSTAQKISNEKAEISETKIVEVPIIRERIIKVPVIKEKIVTRIVYVERGEKKEIQNPPTVSTKDTFALNSSLKDSEFLTQTNLKGFQPVSEIKARITKKGEN